MAPLHDRALSPKEIVGPSADVTRTLVIKHTPLKVVGWGGVAFAFFCMAGAWNAGARPTSLLFLGFGVLSSYLILSSGSMQVDSDFIRYYLPLRSHQITWNEVQYIEIDRGGGSMVFVGDNKKLAVNGPAVWSGRDRFDVSQLIATQIDRYGIELRPTEKAMFRLSRNTKVRRFSQI